MRSMRGIIDVLAALLPVLAVSFAMISFAPALALDADGVIMQDKRWYHGDGLQDGDWYTYVVCGAAVNENRGNCSLIMLNFTGVGNEWNVNARSMDILAEKQYHNEEESIRILDLYYSLMSFDRPNDFWLGIDPYGLVVGHGVNADTNAVNAIRTTLFFLGGELRIGDGYLFQNEPVLGIGEIWSRNADISYTQPDRSPGVWQYGSLSTYTGIRGMAVVTDIRNGYGFCGVGLDGLSYTVSYIDTAKATANIIDGFPFPVSGMATDTGDGSMRVYDDKRIKHPYWYRLVEHSGGHADPDAGGICRLAVDMRNTPPEPKPEPIVHELPEYIDYPLPSWFANYTAMPPDDEPASAELPTTDIPEPEIPIPEKPVIVEPMPPVTPTQDITLRIERDTSFGRDMNTITGTVMGIIHGLDTVALESIDGTGNVWMSFDVPLEDDTYAVRINTNAWDDGSYTIFASYGNETASVTLTVGIENATIPVEEPQSPPDGNQEPEQGQPDDAEVPPQAEDTQEPEPIQPDDNADQLSEYPEPSSGTVTVVGFDVFVGYSIDGGEVLAIYGYDDTQSIVVALGNAHGGAMTLELPYDTATYIAGPELDYDILVDGATLTDYMSSIEGGVATLTIQFGLGIEDIEIGGSVPFA